MNGAKKINASGCRSCRAPLRLLLEFGTQPLSNRFALNCDAAEFTHALKVGQCTRCGLVQLIDPVSAEHITPPIPMFYNEPEGHLDDVADAVRGLAGVTANSRVCGLTYKDRSTLERLRQRSWPNIRCLDAAQDLGITNPAAGLEIIQQRIAEDQLQTAQERNGQQDLLIVRHILEHAHDLPAFISALRRLLAPGGYLIIEVPDCSRAFTQFDFSTFWEEHLCYFTPVTFRRVLADNGLRLQDLTVYPYSLENSMVGIAQVATSPVVERSDAVELQGERQMAERFAAAIDAAKQQWKTALQNFRNTMGKIALLGAGHLAVSFVNLLELSDQIEFLVDDNPEKVGKYLPGAKLPIRPSTELYEQAIRLCLLSVAPESEEKVRARHRPFLDGGGVFASIFVRPDRRLLGGERELFRGA